MWLYKRKQIKSIKDIPECCPFAVYKFTFDDGTFYIGSKQIYFSSRVKLSKKRAKEQYSGKGSYKKFEHKVKESDWKEYKTSSKVVQFRCMTGEFPKQEFLGFYETKKEMLLQEAQLIIKEFLDRNEQCLNSWISLKTSRL